MNPHFFTAPFYFAFIWLRVQGSKGSGFKVQGSGVRWRLRRNYIWGDARSRIILAPSSGRGRRAKRGGVGIPACEKTASRSQPPPLRGTSFQRKEGVCRLPASLFRAKARNLFRLRSRKDVRRGITGNTVLPTTSSRFESQPPPLRGTSFQRKEGEKWNEE